MKHFSINIQYSIFALLLLAGCSSEENSVIEEQEFPSALEIRISTSDFANANGTNTRTTDNGAITTFENGDRVGIIVLDNSGHVLSDNIPYKYNGNTWNFDSSEGKTALYYDNKATNLKYFAYFPYSSDADGMAGDILAILKAKFPPRYDQRTKDAYRASDLLVWSDVTSSVPLKKLEIKFTHAYSLLSLSPSVTCKIDGAETSYTTSSVDDVSFTIGTEPLLAYRADEGSCRIIVSPQTTSARWFCSYRAKMYGGTMPEIGLAANNRYTLAPVLVDMGGYTLDKAQVGDFYCKNNRNEGYLIPGDIASLTKEQQTDCIGIVFKVGVAEGDAANKYDDRLANDVRGYVVALEDAHTDKCAWGGDGVLISTSINQDDFLGYSNTQLIIEKARSTGHLKPDNPKTDYPATYYITQYNIPSASGTSGWYFPSTGQLKELWKVREQIKDKFLVVAGSWLNADDYLSSSEYDRGWIPFNIGYVSFANGYSGYNEKDDEPAYVRAILTF